MFYVVFKADKSAEVERLVHRVKTEGLCLKDVIQQNFGTPLKTEIQQGVGFSVEFSKGDSTKWMDLVAIAKDVIENMAWP